MGVIRIRERLGLSERAQTRPHHVFALIGRVSCHVGQRICTLRYCVSALLHDFTRFRPRIICTETVDDDKDMVHGILDLMASKNYDIRGATWVNTIFVDREALSKKWHWQQADASAE